MGSIPVFSVRIKRFLCSTGYRKRLRWMLKNDSDFVRVTRGSLSNMIEMRRFGGSVTILLHSSFCSKFQRSYEVTIGTTLFLK